MTICRWIIIRIKNVSEKSWREDQSTHFIFSNLFRKIVPFMSWCGILWYSRTAHRRQHNTAHVLCMLGKEGNRYKLRMCNTHCFPTASIVTRRLLNATLIRTMLFFFNPYPTAFPYGNGMVLHFYQQQESSMTKTVHKVINRRLKTYV